MRPTLIALTFMLLLPAAPAEAKPLSTGYVAKVRVASWVPIQEADLEHGISAEAVSVLSRKGLLTFEKGTRRKGLDMKLFIGGEVVEDSGTFTVTLSIRPLSDVGLPSFVTAGTVAISGKSKGAMFKSIISAARAAAKRLAAALRSHPAILARVGGKAAAGALPAMVQWGKVAPRRVKVAGKDLKTFLDGRLSWDRRQEAAHRLSGLAFDDANVRHAIERVALTDPDATTRYYAVRFLAPAARTHRFTQQVLLAVAREDADPKVKREALDLSHAFMGLSKRETLQTWVQLLGSSSAELDNRSFALLVKRISWRPDTPNLDLGLLACLRRQEVLDEGRDRKSECLELVETLSPRRRGAILLGYLGQPFSALGNDLPRRHPDGPVIKAVNIALRRPCQLRKLRAAIWKVLKGLSNPKAEVAILTALAEQQYTGKVVKALTRRLARANERSESYPLMSLLLRAARAHRSDWNVLAWATARKEASRLLGSGDERRDRELERFKEKLDKLKQTPHKAGLRLHLRAEGSPKASAVKYLEQCVVDGADDRARADCAGGLAWLALNHAALHSKAMAAMKTLQQKGAGGNRAQSRLKSALYKMDRILKKKRTPGQRTRDEVCR